MILRGIASVTIWLALSLLVVQPVFAHPLEPRVEISIERVNPGSVVDVRGVAFGMDDSVALSLIGPGVDVSLGEVLADAEGEFKYIAVLPTDLAEGPYYFRAVTSHHFVLSPPLTVWGTAITEGGGQGPRDHDDGLLAPMPTFPPAVATVPSAPVTEATPASSRLVGPFVLAALAVALVVIGLVTRKKMAQN